MTRNRFLLAAFSAGLLRGQGPVRSAIPIDPTRIGNLKPPGPLTEKQKIDLLTPRLPKGSLPPKGIETMVVLSARRPWIQRQAWMICSHSELYNTTNDSVVFHDPAVFDRNVIVHFVPRAAGQLFLVTFAVSWDPVPGPVSFMTVLGRESFSFRGSQAGANISVALGPLGAEESRIGLQSDRGLSWVLWSVQVDVARS